MCSTWRNVTQKKVFTWSKDPNWLWKKIWYRLKKFKQRDGHTLWFVIKCKRQCFYQTSWLQTHISNSSQSDVTAVVFHLSLFKSQTEALTNLQFESLEKLNLFSVVRFAELRVIVFIILTSLICILLLCFFFQPETQTSKNPEDIEH